VQIKQEDVYQYETTCKKNNSEIKIKLGVDRYRNKEEKMRKASKNFFFATGL